MHKVQPQSVMKVCIMFKFCIEWAPIFRQAQSSAELFILGSQKQPFSLVFLTAVSGPLSVMCISVPQNCFVKSLTWSEQAHRLNHKRFLKEAKARCLCNNFVLMDFFFKWVPEAKDTKCDSVIMQHQWRANASENSMASQKAVCCVIPILASFTGVAFTWRFAWMLLDLCNPWSLIRKGEKYFVPFSGRRERDA